FDEAEQTVEEQTPQTFEEVCTPTHTRGKRGRRSIPADLPRVEVSYPRQSRGHARQLTAQSGENWSRLKAATATSI
ncbi:transposase, partial [Solidesulfovibrio aerotolerans]|uniref:transposase n=1 Tax=Solidesulfovibrio aerotolerans TaxID=295255 RepID=UPI001FE2C082